MKLGPRTGSIEDPDSTACAAWALLPGMGVLGGLGKAWTLRAPTEGSPLGCLATFSYLEEILTSRTLEMPHPSSVGTGQTQDRYEQCCISPGPESSSMTLIWPLEKFHGLGSMFRMSGLELKRKQIFLIPSN